MYHTIYLTTNIFNQKKYIGKHSTEDLDDCYLGSGRALKMAIKKYGRETFTKEILFVFDTEEEMDRKEIEMVNESIARDPQYYNMSPGGEGGDVLKFSEDKRITKGEKISRLFKGKPKSEQHRKAISEHHADVSGQNNPMFGKKHSEEAIAKQKIRASQRSRKTCVHCGMHVVNSNYTRWHGDNCKNKPNR